MMIGKIKNFFSNTLRGRLMLSVALVHALMMTLFITDLIFRQRAMLLENQTAETIAMSQLLATSSAVWIAANDVAGLQEIAESQQRYPEIIFVIFADKSGYILAHTDKSKIGLYLLDLPENPQQATLERSAALVDVVSPVLLGERHIGWARVGLGQKAAAQKLAKIELTGFLYALAAIFIGSLIAWRMGEVITRRLYVVQDTISAIKQGNQSARANVAGADEAAYIAVEFNSMLDMLARREGDLRASESRFKKLFHAAAVPLCFVDKDGKISNYNERFAQVFGYTFEDIPTLDEWWQKAYPEPEYRKWVVETWNEAVNKSAATGSDIEPIEYTVTCKDGTVRTMVVSGATLDTDLLAVFFDVTERKRAEESLRENEQLLRTLINSTPDIICFKDGKGRWLEANQSDLELFHLTDVDYRGKTDADLSEFTDSIYRSSFLTCAATDEKAWLASGISRGEEIIPKPDSAHKVFDVIKVPIFEADGKRKGLVVLGRDITERKHAEEEIKKSSALLERIFSSTEFLMAYLDADFNFIRVNRAYAQAGGHPVEFFIGKNHFDLYPHEENEAIFRRVAETGEPYVAYAKPFEYPEYPERGVRYWNWTLQPIKEDGRVSALVLSLIDVTEREKALIAQRESDALYRVIVEQAGDGIFIADPQGNYIDATPKGCAMLGYTREEILKLNIYNLASKESQQKNPIRFKEMREGRAVTSERTLVAKSGKLIPVEINGKALDNGNFIGIVRDITERKQHEMEREAIIMVSNALRKVTTRREILEVSLGQLINLFEADGAILATPDFASEEMVIEMGRGLIGEKFSKIRIPKNKGVSRKVVETRKTYLNNHVQTDPDIFGAELLGSAHCAAAVPLIAQEQTIGALWIFREKNIYEADVRLLNAVADIAANALHRVALYEQTEHHLRHLLALRQIDLTITTTFDINVTLGVILRTVKDELNADAAVVLLLDSISHSLLYANGIGLKRGSARETSISLQDNYAGRAALEQKIISCPDLQHEAFGRSKFIEAEGFTSYHAAPLIVKGQVKGVLEVFHRYPFTPDKEWLDYFDTLATQTAIAVENDNLFNTLQRSNMELTLAYDATIEGWSRALDLRDKETEGHTRRVTEMALSLAEKMGLNHIEKIQIHRGALLHDIGKMGVPDAILNKPGKLSEEEWEVMRRHPAYAYEMLSKIPYLKPALDIPYCHHEKWDGSGYPRGLKGDAIPLAARLFAVVDVFDALTSNRPYRNAISPEEAYRYIQSQAGRHFDPRVVKIFLETK